MIAPYTSSCFVTSGPEILLIFWLSGAKNLLERVL